MQIRGLGKDIVALTCIAFVMGVVLVLGSLLEQPARALPARQTGTSPTNTFTTGPSATRTSTTKGTNTPTPRAYATPTVYPSTGPAYRVTSLRPATYELGVELGGSLIFGANNALYKTDGTAGNLTLIASDFSSTPSQLTLQGSRVFFTASHASHGNELWVYDGVGMPQVLDLVAGTSGSTPRNLTAARDYVYFVAGNTSYGRELYRSNGTLAGSVRVRDINPGTTSSTPENLVYTGTANTIVFTANDGTWGVELWRSDGTSLTTFLLKDIAAGSASPTLTRAVAMGGAVYFGVSSPADQKGLWKSTGTSAGTTRLNSNYVPQELAASNGWLYFNSPSGGLGAELYRSDSTGGVLQHMKDIYPGLTNSNPRQLTPLTTGVVFYASSPNIGPEPWFSDGPLSRTYLLRDIYVREDGRTPQKIVSNGQVAFMSDTDGGNGVELWYTKGTAATTSYVQNIAPGTASSDPRAGLSSDLPGVFALGKFFTFAYSPEAGGVELWAVPLP